MATTLQLWCQQIRHGTRTPLSCEDARTRWAGAEGRQEAWRPFCTCCRINQPVLSKGGPSSDESPRNPGTASVNKLGLTNPGSRKLCLFCLECQLPGWGFGLRTGVVKGSMPVTKHRLETVARRQEREGAGAGVVPRFAGFWGFGFQRKPIFREARRVNPSKGPWTLPFP